MHTPTDTAVSSDKYALMYVFILCLVCDYYDVVLCHMLGYCRWSTIC